MITGLLSIPHLGDWVMMAMFQIAIWGLILWGIYALTHRH
ncbi:hypothetical protein TPY_3342 [Sulfobacillus acidophilus TPY]|uniref:Uncharacterized protein n=1 Tax=Sulfobacillus acidophilus (strain ATCC 700253 / DSM 10332 / NAL) TaxID=679936 RepID=G8TYA4_SULAD|nr:hypothetical protein TPY_3342 [Sulfobacillus acidophilus TPY]AEW05068.1 hypothetical protein Sulac_1571 [Sulfobacillus acidophilus DSM 10332]